MASIHNVLDKGDWTLNEIKIFLEQDSSSINNLDISGLAPLHRVLKDEKCSVDVVKILLFYGANPNGINTSVIPLFLSLLHKRDKEVIKLLIDAGAQVKNIFDAQGHSPLCIALCLNPDPDVVQILLDAGCYLNECSTHVSVLHCAMSNPNSKLTADVCKILIKKDKSFLFLRERGNLERRSFLCLALGWNAEPEAIKLMLQAGCSMNACQVHSSIFLCAIPRSGELKTDTVKLLLDAGAAKVYDTKGSYNNNNTLLNHLLMNFSCETGAIKLLFDCESDCVSANGNEYNVNLCLFNAVKNLHCKPNIVQFLFDQGAIADSLDSSGRSLLHSAVENVNCQPAVVQLLLRNGCAVNARYGANHSTALRLALDKDRSLIVVNMLLKSGSLLKAVGDLSEILKKALNKYSLEPLQDNIDRVKLLLKYTFLENLKFDKKKSPLSSKHYNVFSDFINKCMNEIKILKKCNIFPFIIRHSEYKTKPKGDQLLKIPLGHTFPVYFDVISATYGREAMEALLKVQPIYFGRNISNSSISIDFLNYYVICEIAAYLSDEDLFSMLVAFYPGKPTCSAKEKKPTDKRSFEQPAKARKRSRRYR